MLEQSVCVAAAGYCLLQHFGDLWFGLSDF